MSTAAGADAGVTSPESKNKSKGKGAAPDDVSMEEDVDEDDDDDDDDDMEEDDDDNDDDDDDDDDEIDPSAIVGRRTRGLKVDYTSKEALEKAGLGPEGEEEEETK